MRPRVSITEISHAIGTKDGGSHIKLTDIWATFVEGLLPDLVLRFDFVDQEIKRLRCACNSNSSIFIERSMEHAVDWNEGSELKAKGTRLCIRFVRFTMLFK